VKLTDARETLLYVLRFSFSRLRAAPQAAQNSLPEPQIAGHPAHKTQHPFRFLSHVQVAFIEQALLVLGNRQGRPFRSTDDKNRSKEALP